MHDPMSNENVYEGDDCSKMLGANDDNDDELVRSFAQSRTNSEKSLSFSYSSSYCEDGRHVETVRGKEVKFGKKLPVVLRILFTELCERLVYYGVAANLLVFLTSRLSLNLALASSVVLIFTGILKFS